MLASALIVFREVLEAALVVTVVMAATEGLPHRKKWIALGIAGGIAGASLVAALADIIANAFEGSGQDIVDAAILFVAVGLISWHVVWMNHHGRRMAAELRAMGRKLTEGERHMSVLAAVIGLAVMREGSEVVLMLKGLWTGTGATPAMMIGSVIGLVGGIGAGALLYAGFLRLSVGRLFTLTNGLLVLIAAGMAARAANFLNQADWLPALGTNLWDTSFILSDRSIMGQAMGALIGYVARPSGIELAFYVATILAVLALIGLTRLRLRAHAHRGLPAIMVALIAGGVLLASAHRAHADQVWTPYVERHEWEFENEGIATIHDHNPAQRGAKDVEGAIAYSPTAWWKSEFEGEFVREAGPDQEGLHYDSFNWPNVFQLADAGEYWFDPGLFYEMDFGRGSQPNNVIFGLIGAKQIGRVLATVNLFGHKEFGPGADPNGGFAYSEQTKYRWKRSLQPGFEVFGDTAGQSRIADQQLAVGPGIFGTFLLGPGRDLRYQASYLFGATRASPTQAIRWKLEYEFFL
ncbi:MAG TPA: FTR1 family protein [Alphaproteobacteria bacterium]|nr:FTR1 family protein [Alphaproteobacteria bacterium]